ncbi:MAG: ABC transporter permease [Muribaculaceae bacterium]|nr:ABC transporter permease [Muribaculaceae bacterium]
MRTSIWISSRLRLGGGEGSPAAVAIAVAGVALAVMIMEATLAVVVGFKEGIEAKLAGFDAQITVDTPYSSADGVSKPYLEVTPELTGLIASAVPAHAEMRSSIRQPGMLKTDDNFQGVLYIGQNPDASYCFEKSNVREGEWPDYTLPENANSIVVSRRIADALGLTLGDKVFSTFIIDRNIKLRRHKVAAIYESDFGEYDNSVVYCSLAALQKVAGVDSTAATCVDIRGLRDDEIDGVTARLQASLVEATASGRIDEYYHVGNIHTSGALYYNWLALLDTNVTVIFILMLAVSGFTLVSSLFILVLEKVRTIGILRAIGGSRGLVQTIFTDLGMRLAGMGMLVGNVLGIGLLLLQKYTQIVPLDPEMYYLSSVPVEIKPLWFVVLNLGVAAVSWAILNIPARMAASTDPSKAMDTV